MDRMKFHGVFVCKAHNRRIRDVHPCEGACANVFHELLNVLRRDRRRDLELQNDRVVHFQIQTAHTNWHRARHGEHINLSQTWDPLVIQVDLQHALVECLSGSRFVLLDDIGT